MSNVHLPGPHDEPLDGSDKIAGLNNRRVDEADQIAGNKHEEFGGIAEPVVAKGQPGNNVVRDVVEENHPQAQATKEIEPKVTLDSL